LLRELAHARVRGMLAQLQSVEVEASLVRNDELTVEDDALGKLREQRLAQLGEVAEEGPLVAALKIEIVAVAEHEAAEAVPLRLVQHVVTVGREVARELGEHRLERRS